MKILFYILSFLIPIVGFIIGFIYYSKPEPELKSVGKNCIIIALLVVVISCICYAVGVAAYII